MHSILVAVGRAPGSDGALRAAARISADTGATLHVVRPGGADPHLPDRRAPDRDRNALVEQVLGITPSGLPLGSVEVVPLGTPEAVLGGAREVRADLVVVSPRLSGDVGLDPGLAQVALRADAAVLVAREPVAWPPRRVVVPLLPGDPVEATLRGAGAWAAALLGGADGAGAGIEVQVLYVPLDADELYRNSSLLEVEMERLREAVPGARAVRLLTSIRWGAAPLRRALRSREVQGADLLLLARPGDGPAAASAERYRWFHLLAAASRSALLLPRDGRRPPAARADGRSRSTVAVPWEEGLEAEASGSAATA